MSLLLLGLIRPAYQAERLYSSIQYLLSYNDATLIFKTVHNKYSATVEHASMGFTEAHTNITTIC